MNRHILPAWGSRRIQDISRRDIIALLDGIVDRGTPFLANRTLAVISKLFGWAVERSIIEISPCTGVKRPATERTRERVLGDDELAIVWRAADQLGYPLGTFVKLLVLLGSGGMKSPECAGARSPTRFGLIPGARTNNGRTHEAPLSAAAQALLAEVPRIAGSDYVMTTTGTAPMTGFGLAKRRIDNLAPDVRGWTPGKMKRSERASITSMLFSLRETRMARHSWVNSSMTLSILNRLPSWVRSSMKS
jgi:integrase